MQLLRTNKTVASVYLIFPCRSENYHITGKHHNTDLNNENNWSHGEIKCFGHMELVKYRGSKKINEQSCAFLLD